MVRVHHTLSSQVEMRATLLQHNFQIVSGYNPSQILLSIIISIFLSSNPHFNPLGETYNDTVCVEGLSLDVAILYVIRFHEGTGTLVDL
mgnify:CR=1 FL=1